MRTRISGQHIDNFGLLSTGSVTGWGGWCAGGSGGVGSGVRTLRWAGEGAPDHLRPQRVSGFFGVPFWHGRQLDIWLRQSIARCLCIAAFTFLRRGNSKPGIFCSRTSACGFVMIYFVSSIAVRAKPSLAILAIFNARHMSDSSSCTRPPCLAIVADMLKTYKALVDASNNEIRLLPLPYTLL
jgi:hypothetical protein